MIDIKLLGGCGYNCDAWQFSDLVCSLSHCFQCPSELYLDDIDLLKFAYKL